jgi:hypothetical protein
VKQINTYKLGHTGVARPSTIAMPVGAEVLGVVSICINSRTIPDETRVIALVSPKTPTENRQFYALWSGEPLPEPQRACNGYPKLQYIGSPTVDIHVFELCYSAPGAHEP